MIDAVGSNARCGSDVLIVNELSTTSVALAVRCALAPNAAVVHASATTAATGMSHFNGRLLFLGGSCPLTLFDVRSVDQVCSPRRGRFRRRALRLQPAGNG